MMFMPNFDYTLKDLPTATYYEFVTMKECLDSIILQCTKLFKTSDKLTIEITDIISKQTLSFNIFNGVIQKRKSPILKLFHSHILTRNNAFKSNIKLEVEFRDIVLDLFTMEFSDLIEKWSKILDAKIL
jgi:hypothetical protein